MKKRQSQQEQPDLFSDEEYSELQKVMLENYRDDFEQKKFIPEAEEEFQFSENVDSKRHVLQLDIFDVEELSRMDKQVQEREAQRELEEKQKLDAAIKQAQDLMELPYFPDPKNDNERLLNLQYEYCRNGDAKAWGELITLSYKVLKRLMWKWLGTHHIFLDDIEQDEKVTIALLYVLRRYKETPGWYVKQNFISALKDGLYKHAMKYKTMEDDAVRLEEIRWLDAGK